MKLIDAVQLSTETKLALVGAGGKTTALFRLARQWVTQMGTTVLVTTTTHLALEELKAADQHIEINRPEDLAEFARSLPEGVVLLTGSPVEETKVGGLDNEMIEILARIADENHLPLLIEADGSGQRPLKAPEAHEPVIPDLVNTVLVVVGMQAVGKRLNDIWIHRPERFTALSGTQADSEIDIQAIAKVLLSNDGGLKGIPQHAKRMVLFNQCDTARLAAVGKSVASQLLGPYNRVIYASLQWEGEQEVIAASHPVAGLILAAGGSTRFGQPKQLLDWSGVPFVRAVVETAMQSELSPVVVVTGADAELVEAALQGVDVRIVRNPNWAQGQSTSVKAGMENLPPETQAVVMMLSDQPHIPHSLVDTLVETHAHMFAPIVATMVDHRRGNPVLFDRETFEDLKNIQGDVGGRKIFSRYRVNYVPWVDPRVGMDVDSEEDYQKLLDAWGRN